MTPFSRMVDPLLQRSLKMGKTLATAPEPQFFANVVAPFCAAGTGAAWNADFEGDAIANGEVGDGGPDGGDDA